MAVPKVVVLFCIKIREMQAEQSVNFRILNLMDAKSSYAKTVNMAVVVEDSTEEEEEAHLIMQQIMQVTLVVSYLLVTYHLQPLGKS